MSGLGGKSAWALVNLILAVATAVVMAVLLVGYIKGKREEENEEFEQQVSAETDELNAKLKRKGIARLISVVPAVAAVVAFVLTEDMRLPMQFVDNWTWLMALIALAQAIVAVFTVKTKEEDDFIDDEIMVDDDFSAARPIY